MVKEAGTSAQGKQYLEGVVLPAVSGIHWGEGRLGMYPPQIRGDHFTVSPHLKSWIGSAAKWHIMKPILPSAD